MRAVDTDIWIAEQPLRFGVIELGARMTVVRLGDGSLWVYSPIRPTPELCSRLDELGTVAHIVAPNRFHHLFAGELAERYPDAQLYLAPGLRKKRPDLTPASLLPDDAPKTWRQDLAWVFFAGLPFANEVVFVHRTSRTLLLCDLAFNVGPEAPWLTRATFRLWGHYDQLGPTRFERLLVRDRAAARASLEQILALDFDRIIVAHGRVLETAGPEALRHGFSWLLPAES